MSTDATTVGFDLDTVRFAVLDLLAEDEMDFFEVVPSAEAAAPGVPRADLLPPLRNLAVTMWREGLITACAPDGPEVADPQAAIADPAHWDYAKLTEATPRLCLTAKGRKTYETWGQRAQQGERRRKSA